MNEVDQIALTLRKITDKLPSALVAKFHVNERLSKMLKLTYFAADDILKKQMGVDEPVNYGILCIVFAIASYIPTSFINIIINSF
jgi:hypothetical protein